MRLGEGIEEDPVLQHQEPDHLVDGQASGQHEQHPEDFRDVGRLARRDVAVADGEHRGPDEIEPVDHPEIERPGEVERRDHDEQDRRDRGGRQNAVDNDVRQMPRAPLWHWKSAASKCVTF